MQYHLLLTERCNLRCTYCGGTRSVEGIPLDRAYCMDELVGFIRKDPEAVIGFYGGEPLLAPEFLYEAMDRLPAKAFTLQTNVTHLGDVDPAYLNRLDSVLVSVDGGREVTDACRGAGVYDKVVENCCLLRRNGFRGDLVARMAFSDRGDIARDVGHLLGLGIFDHVHWQLDVFWSDLESRGDLEAWLRRYEAGISELVRFFGAELEEGRVPGLVPFIPVLRSLVTGEPTPHIRCGSGRSSFSIMTSGRIDVCPIAPELSYSPVGDIRFSTPEGLRDSSPVGEPCTACPDLWVCGGRCLYANKTMYWGRGWYDRVCETTRYMIRELGTLAEPTRRLIRDGVLPPDALDYPKINNGCEVIP